MSACAYCGERAADGPDGFCRKDRIAHGARLIAIAHDARKRAAEVLLAEIPHAQATAKLREWGWTDGALVATRIAALHDGCARCGEPFEEEAEMELFSTTQAEPFTFEETVWAHGECPERPKDEPGDDEPHAPAEMDEPGDDPPAADPDTEEPAEETQAPKHETKRPKRETKAPKRETARKPHERHTPKPKTGHRRK